MKQLIIWILCTFSAAAYSQSYKEQFSALLETSDTIAQQELLQKWEKENSNDPELYTCYFNYHVNLSQKEVISIEPEPNTEEYLEIKDSLGQTAGYITGRTIYTNDHVNKALNYINKGISKHPSRLDMRFGKSYLLGEAGDFDSLTNEVVTTLG